jgi:hypothetical protein
MGTERIGLSPNVNGKASQLNTYLSVIHESKLDTLEEKRKLFEKIVEMYDIRDILYIA